MNRVAKTILTQPQTAAKKIRKNYRRKTKREKKRDKRRRGDSSREKEENLTGVQEAGSSPAGIVERHASHANDFQLELMEFDL